MRRCWLLTSLSLACGGPGTEADPGAIRIPATTVTVLHDAGRLEDQLIGPFSIDRDPVTVAEFAAFTAETGELLSYPPFLVPGRPELEPTPAPDDHPAIIGDVAQAEVYCRWRGARLPTEAEWFLAACGTDGRTYPWGMDWEPGRANVDGTELAPIGAHPGDVGAGGLRGVTGNALDLLRRDHSRGDPRYVLRGGGWDMIQVASRCDARMVLDDVHHEFGGRQIGFRCVRGPAEE